MEENSRNFTPVNVQEYVQKGIEAGTFTLRQAEKVARIVARRGTVGEKIASYSTEGVLETTNTVELDPITNQPGWIATKVENGEILVDEFGHRNEWIIPDSTFQKKYEVDPENPYLCRPKGGPQQFVQISDDISFVAPWGEQMNIIAGGYLNVTDMNEIYGIQERDFDDTYRFTDEQYQSHDEVHR